MITELGMGVLIQIKYAFSICMLAFFGNGREYPILKVSVYNELFSRITKE